MTDEPAVGTAYPIVFKFQIPVQGIDYSAGVEFSGGAVVLLEEDGYLAHGLKPGGVAGIGDTLVEAYLDLRQNIELALYDIAEMSADFPRFRRDVRRFFHNPDPWAEDTFQAARERVAQGAVTSDLPHGLSAHWPAQQAAVRTGRDPDPLCEGALQTFRDLGLRCSRVAPIGGPTEEPLNRPAS